MAVKPLGGLVAIGTVLFASSIEALRADRGLSHSATVRLVDKLAGQGHGTKGARPGPPDKRAPRYPAGERSRRSNPRYR